MHELALTQSVLAISLQHAQAHGAAQITAVRLVIGRYASLLDDSIQFYWDLISAETIAAGARLHFRRVPVELECRKCGWRYAPGPATFDCPNCASASVRIVQGEEFYVESIEIETTPGQEASADETIDHDRREDPERQ